MKLKEVVAKDLKVVFYLLVFGFTTVLTNRYLETGEMSVIFGAIANYIVFRIDQELKNEGYREVLKNENQD